MSTKAFHITIASLGPFACALSDRVSLPNEMVALVRFCALLHRLDRTNCASSLYKELCSAIDARNVYRLGTRGFARFKEQPKPTYGNFCRRLKEESAWEASNPDWPFSFYLPFETPRF